MPSNRKHLIRYIFPSLRLLLVFLTFLWLFSGYEVTFGYQSTSSAGWAFPLPGVVGRLDPSSESELVKWDPFATGHLATACYPIMDTQADWIRLESDAPRYGWYLNSEVVLVDKQETCEAMRDIYLETARSGANAVTGRMTVNVREDANTESAVVGALHVGQTAIIMGIYPENGSGTIPWILVELESGEAGYIRADLVLYVRADTECAQIYDSSGVMRLIVADEGIALPASPATLQSVADFIKLHSPYTPPINQPRMVYFTRNHSELVRIAPGMWRQVVGVFSYARWDGCHVQSRHTGVGDLMATAVVDMSHGDAVTNWQITVHELSHLFGAPHEGWMNSYDWELIIANAVNNTCQDAPDEYFVGLCGDLQTIIAQG